MSAEEEEQDQVRSRLLDLRASTAMTDPPVLISS